MAPSARILASLITRKDIWGTLLLLLLAVVSLLAWTPAERQVSLSDWDKANHLAAFGALACVAMLWRGHRPGAWRAVALALLAYGGLIELVQMGIPSRSADWADVLADALGIAMGLGLGRSLLLLPAWATASR